MGTDHVHGRDDTVIHADSLGDRNTDIHADAQRRLDEIEQRYTTGRRTLVDTLASAAHPLTIQQVLERVDSMPQSSAYRNLSVLEDAGVVHRIVTTDDFARFELAEHLTEHHHHLICSDCGDVVDFTLPADLEQQLDRDLADAADAAGFQASQHNLDLVGTCARCQSDG